MKHCLLAVTAALIVILVLVTSGTAQNAEPRVINPNSVAFGATYSEWSARWWQWALSIPVTNHPLFDNGDCSVGQTGPVWFLGGKFCATDATNCGTNNVVRSCQVPAGKALYVAVLNAENSALEWNDPKAQIAALRAASAATMDSAANFSFQVDGAAIPHLQNRFRIQSTTFGFTIPDDNLFTAIGEGTFAGGSYFPAADDAVYVMLAPPPPGHHTIQFHSSLPALDFVLDITYHLNVVK